LDVVIVFAFVVIVCPTFVLFVRQSIFSTGYQLGRKISSLSP
jgi:hypothetical protein